MRHLKVLALVAAVALILACVPSLTPVSAPIPTFDPNSVSTAIAQTAQAAGTQTALFTSPTPTSTNTPFPTAIPSETPLPTVTFIFILPTPTVPTSTPKPGSSGLKFDCRILSKNPEDNVVVGPNSTFNMVWEVINVGTELWHTDDVDYRYKSGDKLHTASAYDLENIVLPGGQTDIRVAMKAPGSAGTYSTVWIIRSGRNEFCRMSITIKVP